MKKILLALILLTIFACGSKKKTGSAGGGATLETRLSEYMKLNDEMNLDKIMDYIYPKLFTIASREELLKAMKDGFNNDDVKIEIDSMKVEKIHPVFEMNNGSYAKVDYSMIMVMDFKRTDDRDVTENPEQKDANSDGETESPKDDDDQTDFMVKIMSEKFGKENVSLDGKRIKIRVSSPMVAVKDKYAREWSFVNLNKEDGSIEKIFSKELLDKLDTYK